MNVDRYEPGSLPAPDAAALARSATLCERIRAEIGTAGGWMPFSRFMEMALYTPGLGYYSSANAKFGRHPQDGSDFITAPELTPLFARTLAQPVAELLAATGTDEILEFGAGTGKLAADLLLALDAIGDNDMNDMGDAGDQGDADNTGDAPLAPAAQCRRYTIVELSGELRERQRATLFSRAPHLMARVQWVDRLPDSFSGVVLGNEVLDAMPVDLQVRIGNVWHDRGVGLDEEGEFVWRDRVSGTNLDNQNDLRNLRSPRHAALASIDGTHDYLTETHEAAAAFVGTVCAMLTRGALLLIDYGFPRHEYQHPQRTAGTLMCHYRHRAHGNPFFYPGLQDITAHVDFTGIAAAGIEAGATLLGYTSQARFLINAGITDTLAMVDPVDARHFLPLANAVQKLLSEAEMGELFKVIGFGRGLDPQAWQLDAFGRGDRSAALFVADERDADNDPIS